MLCCELTRRTQQTICVQRWYVATVAQVTNVKSIFGNRMEIWYVLLWPLLAWSTFWRHLAIILKSFWFHFEFIMVSFWYHFAVSLNSLWYHFGFILVSVWYHFVFILVSFWYHFEGIRETTKIVPFWRFQEKWFGTPLTGNFLAKEPQMEMTFLTRDFLVKMGVNSKPVKT